MLSFAPHILQKKKVAPVRRDEFGRPIEESKLEEWITICRCRCDDNTTKEITSANGEVFRPSYHIVCEGGLQVCEGDEIRCLKDSFVRGAGRVINAPRKNYFGYYELWV